MSAWEAGEPTSQVVFQTQRWPLGALVGGFSGGSGPLGPEQLIRMATGQLPDASSRRQCRHL